MGEEKYTQKVLEAMQSAQQEAALRYHQEITSAHVLAALIKEPEGLLATMQSRPADAQGETGTNAQKISER